MGIFRAILAKDTPSIKDPDARNVDIAADIAIVTKFRTNQRHSCENANLWIARLSRWTPACARMTDNR
jgi:hypothetical protein